MMTLGEISVRPTNVLKFREVGTAIAGAPLRDFPYTEATSEGAR